MQILNLFQCGKDAWSPFHPQAALVDVIVTKQIIYLQVAILVIN